MVKRKSVPHTPASNSGAKKAKSDDEDHHQEVDVKRIKAEPEPSGSGQQAVMGDEGGIGDDSYAGIYFEILPQCRKFRIFVIQILR